MLKNCLRLYIYMVVESYGVVLVKYNPGDEEKGYIFVLFI